MTSGPGFTDWPDAIGDSVLLRQQLHELEPEVNPYTLPHVAASDEQLAQAVAQLGRELDPVLAQFLRFANGWEEFFVFTHLFGTDDLGRSARWRAAEELVDVFYASGGVPADFPDRANVYCIAADAAEVEDLFVVWGLGPVTDGGRPVSWIAGEEVQRFANAHELLLGANDYLREDLA